MALAACAIIFVVGLANGLEVMEIFMTSVSLAVSAIPEGLPVIVTIVLSIGVQRMVKKNALIRRLLKQLRHWEVHLSFAQIKRER